MRSRGSLANVYSSNKKLEQQDINDTESQKLDDFSNLKTTLGEIRSNKQMKHNSSKTIHLEMIENFAHVIYI